MSPRTQGAYSATFVFLALLCAVLVIVSAWWHQPPGIVCGFIGAVAFTIIALKVWGHD